MKGVFSSNVHQYDSALVYIHLNDARRVFRLGDKVTSLRLKLADLFDAPRLQKELGGVRKDVFLYDWTTSNGSLFRALALEKRAMFIVLTLIVAVAAFNIVSALVTMVRNKRGDIAILRAMGATGGAITRAFLLQGMLIGGMGVLAGLGAVSHWRSISAKSSVGWRKNLNLTFFPEMFISWRIAVPSCFIRHCHCCGNGLFVIFGGDGVSGVAIRSSVAGRIIAP